MKELKTTSVTIVKRVFQRLEISKNISEQYMQELKTTRVMFVERVFYSLEILNIKTVHEGIKDHKCDHCEKWFPRADNLKRHVKVVHDRV